ncbi:MAG TPA: PmoA family protein [Mariniphaga sp.]|nr:PmoA family protein [Mariniphaga sp.]
MNRIFISAFLIVASSATLWAQPKITVKPIPEEKKVDILIDGSLFTSYIYPDDIKKPVLWPVITAGGNEVTRQYPLKKKEGERVDHPHHIGVWLNYGDVNGLDFWNNSEAIAPEKAQNYGTIYHKSIGKTKSGKGKGSLVTSATWQDHKRNVLLDEVSEYVFSVDGKTRIIDRTTRLKAINGKVKITDNKEGMFAIRVARELELPSKGKVKLSDSHGNITEVDASGDASVSGSYLSSEGIKDDAVWATRGRWMKLSGVMNGEKVALVIFDHPSNPGYPTYWHARGYGLFAANTLGQSVFSEGKEALNFELNKGQSASFKYRLAVFSSDPSVQEIEKMASDFSKK